MIKIVAGGKKNAGWVAEACAEYEKRLRKPFVVEWRFLEEVKLADYLAKWPFAGREYVVLLDERGENLSSPELSKKLEGAFSGGKNVVLIIGGAYGVEQVVREKADLVLSFSRLVFPHMLARVMAMEQVYRAQEIARGGKYHHG